MKKIVFVAIICLTAHYASAQKPLDRIPYKLSDDFETGELFSWEPYPYEQDAGYDALYFAHQTPTHNNSRYALARPVRANETAELSQGFTKRLANEKSPVAKSILDRALQNTDFMNVDIDAIKEGEDNTAEALTGGPYAPRGVASNGWDSSMTALAGVIEGGSFRYAFTGDAAAGEKAKKALLKLCSFSKWNNNWMLGHKFWTYYPLGESIIRPVAYGYDMLHGILTEEERKLVRNAIMEKGLKLFYRDMVEMNRMPSNNANHEALLVSGMGLAATAIYGEPKSGYMHFATSGIAEFLAPLERNFGIDYSSTTNVQDFYKYPLQATHSSGRMQDYGDGTRPKTTRMDALGWVGGKVERTGAVDIGFSVPETMQQVQSGDLLRMRNGSPLLSMGQEHSLKPILKEVLCLYSKDDLAVNY